jgi:hypothetical protein
MDPALEKWQTQITSSEEIEQPVEMSRNQLSSLKKEQTILFTK